MIHERLLTPAEAAQRLRVSVFTVRRWVRQGRLRAVRLGRLWRIPADEIERLAEGKGFRSRRCRYRRGCSRLVVEAIHREGGERS